MEEKMYDREVIKESLALRVVDKSQIARHFTGMELSELYEFRPFLNDADAVAERPQGSVPKDKDVMASLLFDDPMRWVVRHHEHDSLLAHKEDEILSKDEEQAAWKQYEDDRRKDKTMSELLKEQMPADECPEPESFSYHPKGPTLSDVDEDEQHYDEDCKKPMVDKNQQLVASRKTITIKTVKREVTVKKEEGDKKAELCISTTIKTESCNEEEKPKIQAAVAEGGEEVKVRNERIEKVEERLQKMKKEIDALKKM